MNIPLIAYTVAMAGFTIILLFVSNGEAKKITRILSNKGKTISVDKKVGEPYTTVDFRDMGKSNVYSYLVDGKTYSYETKLTMPFSFGKKNVTILYEKSNPKNAVQENWIEMYGVSAFVTLWTIGIIISTIWIWVVVMK